MFAACHGVGHFGGQETFNRAQKRKAECRRQGVYRTMHEAIRREARATPGVCGIRLYVEGTNRTAQQAYRQAGMRMSTYQVYEEDFVLPPQERKESI